MEHLSYVQHSQPLGANEQLASNWHEPSNCTVSHQSNEGPWKHSNAQMNIEGVGEDLLYKVHKKGSGTMPSCSDSSG